MARHRTCRTATALAFLFVSSGALAGSIAGRLIDPSGKPIAGARVEWLAYRNDDERLLDRTSGKEPPPLGGGATDANGRFRIPLDRPGVSVSVRILAPGFSSLRLPGPYDPAEEQSLDDLAAAAARPMSGRVVDESGAPVPGAQVTVTRWDRALEEVMSFGKARTLENGAFSVPDAPDGPREVLVSAPGFVPLARTQLEPRGEERIVLSRGGAVRGTVTDPAGKPAAGAIVTTASMAVETDAGGAYHLSGMPAGIHTIVAIAGEDLAARRDGVRVRTGEENEIRLRLARAALVAGTVVDESTRRPIAGARLSVSETRGFVVARDGPARRGRTDARGRYRIGALLSRVYSVTASREGFLSSTIPNVAASLTARTVNIALRRAAIIAGRVSDEDGRPIPGAQVRVAETRGLRAVLRRSGPAVLLGGASVVSGPEGLFRLKGLVPARNLELEATRSGYAAGRQAGITLKPGDVLRDVSLRLRKGFQARGRVVDGRGNPIAGARIRAVLREAGSGQARTQLRILGIGGGGPPDALSGPDGVFVLRGMEEGHYTVAAEREGFARKAVPSLAIQGSGENVWPPIVLSPGIVIAGFVRDSAGQPVPGARIVVVERGGAGARPTDASSDTEGRFRVDDLTSGHPVIVSASASGYATLQKNVTPPVSDLVLTLKTAGVVRGRVQDAETRQPITDFTIGRTGPRAGGPFPIVMGAVGGDRAFHSEDGSFELVEVPPGKWTLRASATGYRAADVGGVEVGEAETKEGIVLSLKKGGTLTGRVLDALRRTGIANASVSWRPSGGAGAGPGGGGFARAFGPADGASTSTDADGRFELDSLPSGRVALSASHPDYLDGMREVDANDESVVELTLGSGGAISGSVVGQDGRTGIGGAQVSLNPEGDTSPGFNGDSIRADTSGQFLFEHLAAGRYQLLAQSTTGKTTTREVVLGDNQRVDGVLLGMAAGARISGTISGLPTGQLGGVRVAANASGYSDSAVTDDSGAFVLTDVPSGAIRLQATTSMPGGRSTGKTVEVPDGGDLPVEIVFEGASRLAGRVTRGEKPLAGLFVNANLTSPSAAPSRASAQTDDNGQYALEGLIDGDYTVNLAGQGVSYRRTFTVSGDTSGDIALPSIQVRGTVTDTGSGEPLDGATVSLQPAQGSQGFPAKQAATDSSGHFFFDDVDPGSYQATARRSGYQGKSQSVTIAADSVDANFDLQKGEGLSILVVDGSAGLPLRAIWVAAFGGDGVVAYQGSVALDSSGKGDIASLGPGRYLLYVFSDGYASRSLPVDAPSQGASIALTPGGRIQVRCGSPMSGRLVDSSGARYLLNPWRTDGRINLAPPLVTWDHVAPGAYTLFAGPAGAERPFELTVVEGQTAIVEVR